MSVAGLLDRTGRLKAPDFLQFYTYGALVNAGAENRLYDASAHAEIARRVDQRLTLSAFQPNYSPVIALFAAPLARLPFPSAMAVFSALSVALYCCAVGLLTRVTASQWNVRAPLVLFAAAWPTVFVLLRYGQLSALSLLVVSAATFAAARSRVGLAGLVLGLLVYKPNLLVTPVLLFLMMREWRLLAGLAMGAGAQLLVDLAVVGPLGMRQYIGVLINLAQRPELVQFFPAESHSVRGFVRLLLPWPGLVTVTGLVAIPLATWLAVRVWHRHHDWRPRWSALVTAALLASPHLLTYDLLLLAVPLVLIADWQIEASRGDTPEEWRWGLALLYFGAWPGTFIARLYHVQISTVGMLLVLWLLARAPRAGRA